MIGLEDDALRADVGRLVLAEGEDAARRCGRRMGAQALEIGVVAVDHRRAARLEAGEDLALGVGDAPDRAEELDVHRLDRGDDRHVRAHHRSGAGSRRHGSCRSRTRRRRSRAACARASAARPNGCCRTPTEACVAPWRERARRSASLVPVLPTEPVTATIFARVRRRAARPEPAHGLEHVRHDDQRARTGELGRPLLGDDSRRGALGQRVAHEIVAVARLALDGEEEVARLERARVDRDPGASAKPTADARAGRGGDLVSCPERRFIRALPAMAPRTSSWSENGRVRSPMIWPVS